MPFSPMHSQGRPVGTANTTAAKITPPPLRPNRVLRHRLIQRFGDQSEENVFVVVAPAGFGKTTLLAEWALNSAVATAWVSLDENDNYLGRFWSLIGSSLVASGSGVTRNGTEGLKAADDFPIETALAPLLSELSAVSTPTSLILDDYNVISNDRVHKSVQFLLEHLPGNVRVVFGTRTDLPFPTSRLRAHGRLVEIRATALAFNEPEAAELIKDRTTVSLSSEELTRIVEETDGWVMGIRAAAFAFATSATPESGVSTGDASQADMPGFLRREVFDRQSEQVQEFLVQSAVLDQLNSDLCNFTLQRSDSASFLELLERSELFLSAIDESRTWFRVHPLVLQLLRSSLAELPSEERINLHRRASEWLASHGQLEPAIRHALAGEHWSAVIDLIARLGQYSMPTNRPAEVNLWLTRIPREYLVSQPYACVQLARNLMFGNLHSDFESLLGIAEASALQSGDKNLLASILNVRSQAECFRGNQDKALEMIDTGLELLAPDEMLTRGMFQQLRSVCLMLSDRIVEAEAASIQGFQNSLAAGNAHTACLALGMRGFISLRRGRPNDAYRYNRQALSLAESSGIKDLYLLPFHRSRIELESLKFTESDSDLVDAQHAFEQSGYRIFMFSVHLCRARLQWMQGKLEAAEESLRLCEESGRTIGAVQDVFTIQSLRLRIGLERKDWQAVRELLNQMPANIVESRLTWMRSNAALSIELGDIELAKNGVAELYSALSDVPVESLGTDVVSGYVCAAALELELGREDDALAATTQAVKIAAPGELFGPFWEHRLVLNGLLKQVLDARIEAEFVGELLARLAPRAPALAPADSKGLLSAKELEILALLAQGCSNRAIADRTQVSQNTVKTHLQHIYSKLDAKNRTQAVAHARALQIIS